MKQGICHHCEVIESQANTCEGSQDRKSQVFRTQQQCRRRPVWNTKSNFNTRRPEMRYYSVDLHLHLKFKPYIAKTPQQNKKKNPSQGQLYCSMSQGRSTQKTSWHRAGWTTLALTCAPGEAKAAAAAADVR